MSPAEQPLLTDTELELMLILWQLGEATVHVVRDALPSSRPMAYTTVSTMIRILEKKGFVGSHKVGKAHLYYPLIDKTTYEARTLGHVVGRLFDNTPSALVARLIDQHTLSADDIKELKKLLNKKRE